MSANDLRLYAAEIIRQLYTAGEVDQLKLLKLQCERSLAEIEKARTGHNPPRP